MKLEAKQRLKATDELSPVLADQIKKLEVGTKVYHPVHGSGTVLNFSRGAGSYHWVEVKFVSGEKRKVDRKSLKLG
jgi:hypothetical protein